MALYLTVMRVIHIFAAVFWAGGLFFTLSVLLPTVREAGPDGGKFMQRLAMSGRLSRSFTIASGITVLSGLLIYFFIYKGNPFTSGPGTVLTIGAIFGALGFLHGAFITGPVSRRSGALAKAMAARQGPPEPEQLKEAQALGARLARNALHSGILVALALLGMAAAQYFTF